MKHIDKSIRSIKNYQSAQHLTNEGLSKLAGLSRGTLRYMDKQGWNPRADTLRKLEDLTNI